MSEMEMAEQIAQVLGDENAMNMIRSLAQNMGGNGADLSGLVSLLGGGGSTSEPQGQGGHEVGPFVALPALGSAAGTGSASGGAGSGHAHGDPNVELIRALKPFLSGKRRQRAGQAVKIMKLVELAPLLQQSGMLGNLMGGGDDD